MLGETWREIRGTIIEMFQNQEEERILKKRQTQYINDIVEGKFLELLISDTKIAQIIVQWCDKEENPVKFFLQCLSKMGVETPIKLGCVTENLQSYSFVMKEKKQGKVRILYISKAPKEFLTLEILLAEKVHYNVRQPSFKIIDSNKYKTIFEIEEGKYSVQYCREEIIKIYVGNDITIRLKGVDWKQEENLYKKTKDLIEDFRNLDENLAPHTYYTAVKEKIVKHYALENVEITLSMKFLSIATRDGKIVDYKDSIKGITIKNYNKWYYKEYCTEKEKVVFENSKVEIEGVETNRIQKVVDTAEKAIKEVESLKY